MTSAWIATDFRASWIVCANVGCVLVCRPAAAGYDFESMNPKAVLNEPERHHAGAVVLHPDGALEGAHDPRADGGAAGL